MFETTNANQETIKKSEVKKPFEDLGLDLEKEYPKIAERLNELHEQKDSHFQDALEMAKIIDKLWDKLEIQDVSKEKMILAALLHDIGKSGPANASKQERKIIQTIFSKDLSLKKELEKPMKELSLRELVENTEHEIENEEIEKYLKNDLQLPIESWKAIDFWQLHASWTYDILKKNSDGKIDEELINIASSHHILDGINPAGLNEDEITHGSRTLEMIDKYYSLVLIDKYQAFRERSHKTHQEAIELLIEMVEKSAHGEESRKHYINLIEKMADSKDILDK